MSANLKPLDGVPSDELQSWIEEIGIELNGIVANSQKGDRIVAAGLLAQRREIWAELARRATEKGGDK